ncbi:MAG: ScyD/ScyE family protein [Bacteroidales bacterium]
MKILTGPRAWALGVIVLAALGVSVSAVGTYTVVAGGLANPRGLTFAPDGRLYVAQAGTGDHTGVISEIRGAWTSSPSVRNVLTGLLSIPGERPGEYTGVDGLSALGNGNIAAIMSESEAGGEPSPAGHLLQFNPGGQWRDLANVGTYNYAWSQAHQYLAPNDFQPGDSNPYGVLAVPGGVYVADAGTNTLNFVKANGEISILAYFPNNVIADATPTCIAKGPDNALYVGTLAFVDSIVRGPQAVVYRVDPADANPDDLNTILTVAKPWATGLFPITGCGFGPDGNFYATQFFTQWPVATSGLPFRQGDVVKIPFATPTVHTSLTGGSLLVPGGLAVGPDGAVYVANKSAFVPAGEVVRLANR